MEFERITYYQDDDIKVYLEEVGEQVFIHVAIYSFSKSVLKKIKAKWGEVIQKMYINGYEEAFTYTKDSRIVKMIGYPEMIGQKDGYEVWKWELK
jgi:hypothetical protein